MSDSLGLLSEAEPQHDVMETPAPGIGRLVAANPSAMTYHGTNTYLVEQADGLAVIDPGPDLPAHVEAILRAGDGRIRRILLTHTHRDHVGAAAALATASGAPVLGLRPPAPGEAIADGHSVGAGERALVALHTPGHAADHLCFRLGDTLFTGDHVMGWSTSVVWPPDGNMAAYMASLRLLLASPDRLYLPGHGPPVREPHRLVRAMLMHRQQRENRLLAALADDLPHEPADLLDALYGGLDPALRVPAERVILAHLLKLEADAKAVRAGASAWRRVTPRTG